MFRTYRRIYGAAWRAAKCPVVVYTGEICPKTGAALKCLRWQSNPFTWRNPLQFIAWENGFHAGMMERGINAR